MVLHSVVFHSLVMKELPPQWVGRGGAAADPALPRQEGGDGAAARGEDVEYHM